MENGQAREKLLENLRDAGCTEAEIRAFLAALDGGRKQEALAVLAGHRQALLRQFHRCSDCIGCLDYLVMQIQKESV